MEINLEGDENFRKKGIFIEVGVDGHLEAQSCGKMILFETVLVYRYVSHNERCK